MAAPTGIAATLLINGSTLHRLFFLPLDIDEASTSRLEYETFAAQVNFENRKISLQKIRDIDVLIIDEMTMVSREVMHAIETLCRYLDPQKRFFGGKVNCLQHNNTLNLGRAARRRLEATHSGCASQSKRGCRASRPSLSQKLGRLRQILPVATDSKPSSA